MTNSTTISSPGLMVPSLSLITTPGTKTGPQRLWNREVMIRMGGHMLLVAFSRALTVSTSIPTEQVSVAGGSVYLQGIRKSSNMQQIALTGSTIMGSRSMYPSSNSLASLLKSSGAHTDIKSWKPSGLLPREPIPLQRSISLSLPNPKSGVSIVPLSLLHPVTTPPSYVSIYS